MAMPFLVNPRRDVGWLEVEPAKKIKNIFAQRDLILSKSNASKLVDSAYVGNLAALLVVLDAENKLPRTIASLDAHVVQLIDDGCEVIVIASDRELPRLIKIIEKHKLPVNGLLPSTVASFDWQDSKGYQGAPSLSFFYAGTPWKEIARIIEARRLSERPNLALKLDGSSSADEHLRLIRRTFSNFASVHLTAIDDGFSGATVYRAQAESGGGKPIPYFMKIAKRSDILNEYNGYILGVEPFVPFHLAPPLLKENCCLGADCGVLLGHYVTESESLLECAEGGRAISPIACLFSRTLNAWHRPAKAKPLSEYLVSKFPSEIAPENIVAAETLGNVRSLDELHCLFSEAANGIEVPHGGIHGDLHAKNVRVRGNDAVIIDMAKHSVGPLLWDPACLEASFLIEGFAKDKRELTVWLGSISKCYTDELFTFWSHEHLTDESSWFHIAVNQIRLYVHSMVPGEVAYLITLAVAFLWKASKPVRLSASPSESDKSLAAREALRRGGAYLIAQGLIEKANLMSRPVASS